MSQLTIDNRRTIERWTGPLEDDDLEATVGRLATLESPLVVAYEILSIRYSALMALPDELRVEGDGRARWVESKKQLERHIDRLVGDISRSGVSLNQAASDVMESALSSLGSRRITARPYVAPNPRP